MCVYIGIVRVSLQIGGGLSAPYMAKVIAAAHLGKVSVNAAIVSLAVKHAKYTKARNWEI